jgi:hypothetical protein
MLLLKKKPIDVKTKNTRIIKYNLDKKIHLFTVILVNVYLYN